MTKRRWNRVIIGMSIFLILSGGLVIYFLIQVDNALKPDPDFNTVFTEKFDPNKFDRIKTGDKIDFVIETIGKPCKIDTIEFFEQLLYTNSPDYVFFIEGENRLRFRGGSDSLKYSSITLNENGDVINVLADFELGGKNQDRLMSLNKEQLIFLFGKPQKHMVCDCRCIVFSYSKLKEGVYRGKLPVIDLRKVLLKDNVVVGKVKRAGAPYNAYVGTCEITKNSAGQATILQ